MGVWVCWELRSTLGPKLPLYMGLIKEEEFIFCLRAAKTSQSSMIGALRGTACAPQPNIKKPPGAPLKRQIDVASSHVFFLVCNV